MPLWTHRSEWLREEREKRENLLEQARDARRRGSRTEYGSVEFWNLAAGEMDAEVKLCDLDWTVEQRIPCFTSNSAEWHKAEIAYLKRREEIEEMEQTISRGSARATAREEILSYESARTTPVLRAAYVELLLRMYGKTNRQHQPGFAKDIMQNYGFKREHNKKYHQVWCPTFEKWIIREDRTAAHLFPLSLGQTTMTYIFEAECKREINAAENGLFLPMRLKRAFDNHQILIVPVEGVSTSQIQEWRYLVLDQTNLWEIFVDTGVKFKELHNKILQFQPGNSFRPRYRFLYFRYLLSMLLINREDDEEDDE